MTSWQVGSKASSQPRHRWLDDSRWINKVFADAINLRSSCSLQLVKDQLCDSHLILGPTMYMPVRNYGSIPINRMYVLSHLLPWHEFIYLTSQE